MNCAIMSSGEELCLTLELQNLLRKKVARHLSGLYLLGYTDFYLNCNRGIPLWIGEMLCEDKAHIPVRLHMIAPHEEHSSEWDESLRDKYFDILSKANSVYYARHPDDTDCAECADRILIAQSDLVVAYAGESVQFYGMEYIKQHGLPVQLLQFDINAQSIGAKELKMDAE